MTLLACVTLVGLFAGLPPGEPNDFEMVCLGVGMLAAFILAVVVLV